VPYRANVWALASLGLRALVGPSSCGSLQPDVHPGDFVIVDQLIDRTHGRNDTFHDIGAPEGSPFHEGSVHHEPFAEPYDAGLRANLVRAARTTGQSVHDGGTMVVVNGPRFSTRAESTWFRKMGWTVVNMTGYPEAVLAAEAGIPYASIALVTDYDAGVDGHEPVTMDAVMRVMNSNIERLRGVLGAAITAIA
jgi:5'-methylthioadenosine phosphorylase